MESHEHSDYPLLAARSGRFRFGAPRSFSPTADGRGIAFIRSRDGLTAAGDLWWLDLGVPGGQEQLLLASDDVLTAHAEGPAARGTGQKGTHARGVHGYHDLLDGQLRHLRGVRHVGETLPI